jgi:hypothetical protein
MMHWTHKKFSLFEAALLAVMILLVLLPVQGQAQENVSFSLVEVDLWPEFDQPTVLVINRITLSPEVSLPAEIRFRIPARAGIPNAVAGRQPDGVMLNIPYDQEPDGAWTWLVFQAATPELQVEYYDPDLLKDGKNRHFEYAWPGDHAVGSLFVEVQQPTGASNMQIKPGMVSVVSGSDGLTYYTIEVGVLPSGQPFSITLDYEKSNDDLSFNNLPIEPGGPLDDTASGRMNIASALPWVLGFLGVLLLVGGGVWYWQSGRESAQPQPKRRKRKKASTAPISEPLKAGEYVYCSRCGKRASKGDRFCRSCGAELRG